MGDTLVPTQQRLAVLGQGAATPSQAGQLPMSLQKPLSPALPVTPVTSAARTLGRAQGTLAEVQLSGFQGEVAVATAPVTFPCPAPRVHLGKCVPCAPGLSVGLGVPRNPQPNPEVCPIPHPQRSPTLPQPAAPRSLPHLAAFRTPAAEKNKGEDRDQGFAHWEGRRGHWLLAVPQKGRGRTGRAVANSKPTHKPGITQAWLLSGEATVQG